MIRQLFLPATLLMNRLRFNLKFSLIVLLFLLPLMILATTYYRQVDNLSNHTLEELAGLDTFGELNQLQQQLVMILVADMAWRSGQTIPAEQTDRINSFINQLSKIASGENLDDHQKEVISAAIQKTNKALQEKTSQLGNARWNAVDNFDALSLSLNQFNNLYLTIANLNGLTNDPQVDTVMLARVLAEKRLIWLTLVAKSYGVSSYALGEGNVSSGTFDSLSSTSDELVAKITEISNISSFKEGLDPALQSLIQADIDAALKSVDEITLFLEEQFLIAEEVTLDKAAMDQFFGTQLKHFQGGYAKLAIELEARLEARISQNSKSLMSVAFLVLLTLLLVIYLFVGMSLSISMTTNSLSNNAQKLADGDTTVSAKVRTNDELAIAIKAFNRMAVKVHDLVESVQQAALGVSDQSQKVEQLASQSGEAVATQLTDTQAITGAIAELLEVVSLVSQNTDKVVNALQRASDQTLAGRDTLAGARRATHELADEINRSVGVINQLSQQSDSINQVLDVIKSIAEQTNLLALNAAIEAARAGEQGRGFAVVADEVRSLAKRTHQSIEEIQDTITSLQQGVSNAVEAMTNSDQKAHRSIEESAKLEMALDQITEAVEEIKQQNEETNQASHRQQGIADQIETSLQSISQISTIAEDNVQQSITASQQLADHVSKLDKLIANFKT